MTWVSATRNYSQVYLQQSAAAAGVAFGWRQRNLADPLVDLRLLPAPAFSTTLGSMLAFTAPSGRTMLLSPRISRWSPGCRR